jgi:hypothetical protein
LHAGGVLTVLKVEGVASDLSIVQEPGLALPAKWVHRDVVGSIDP